MAEETLLTPRSGPKSRVKAGHEYDGGMAGDRSYKSFCPFDIVARACANALLETKRADSRPHLFSILFVLT